MLHYNPQRVSNSTLLIFRRTNCIITVSGIVTLGIGERSYSNKMRSAVLLKQVTDESIMRRKRFACWINKARIHRVIAISTYGFFMATMVSRKHVNVTIYLHCLSSYTSLYFTSSVAKLSVSSSVEFSYNKLRWSNQTATPNYVISNTFIKLLPKAWSFVCVNLLYENLIVFIRNVNTRSIFIIWHMVNVSTMRSNNKLF
jgi:hypothetical protein